MIPPSTPGKKCELYPGLKLPSPLNIDPSTKTYL